jgi:steroid delta-isomerase-like uncharacterized protein
MSQKNVETLRATYQSWNKRDFDGVVRSLADRITFLDHATGRTVSTRQEFRTWAEDWAKTFSDGKILNPEFIDGGDYVVGQFTAEGTNDGPFAGMQPTGRRMSFPYCEIWRFDQNGRMASGGCYYDLYTILTQLGHAQKLAQAA